MSGTSMASEGLLRKSELAQRLKVSARTIDNWVSAGRIPCLRIGRVTRFDWAAVLQALERYTVAAR